MTDRERSAQTSEGGGAALPEGTVSACPAHSPEPWRTYADGCFVLDARGQTLTVAFRDMSAVFRNEADARRIVACVNACSGLPTEMLEAGALAKALDACTIALLAADQDSRASVSTVSLAFQAYAALALLREPIPATPPPEHADAAPPTTEGIDHE